MNDFVRYLKPRYRQEDKVVFNEWMERKITTEDAIRKMKDNNGMRDVIINSNEFIIWMSSLGYRRNYEE